MRIIKDTANGIGDRLRRGPGKGRKDHERRSSPGREAALCAALIAAAISCGFIQCVEATFPGGVVQCVGAANAGIALPSAGANGAIVGAGIRISDGALREAAGVGEKNGADAEGAESTDGGEVLKASLAAAKKKAREAARKAKKSVCLGLNGIDEALYMSVTGRSPETESAADSAGKPADAVETGAVNAIETDAVWDAGALDGGDKADSGDGALCRENGGDGALCRENGGSADDGSSTCDGDELYWLSRIINAESGTQPMLGKIAVGNVVLNRVRSDDFPDTVYGVIFDRRFGVQFSPTENGTIYNEPSDEAVEAARLCLDGYSLSDEICYFFNPAIAESTWISENRPWIMTVGDHAFYG